jgi:dolichyl-phosphate-mannose--protein O-mannosyl transferase
MEINKLDILTIFILSTIFFSIAIVNLGVTQVPINNWKTKGNTDFYVDLGRNERVGTLYFLIKNSSETRIHVHTGSPGNWDSAGIIDIKFSYYVWTSGLNIEVESQFIGFKIDSGFIEIAEIAILDSLENKKPIASINSENSSSLNLSYLVDEQHLVQLPATYLEETYFDEIYFVRTADNYLNSQHPYEWTHPPLGKLIMASGISIFGFNPFGWRIMGVIFATLMISIIYFIGKILLGSWIGGMTAAFLLTFDFMHFTLARMATVDTFVIFFSITSQLFFLIYLKKVLSSGWKEASTRPLFFAFIFFALGFATKWIAIYGFVAQMIILFLIRLNEVLKMKESRVINKINAFLEHPYSKIIEFSLLAVLVYFLTYIPDILIDRTILDVFGLQGGMFSYHSGLEASHEFSSSWWSWPLILRPVWLDVSYLVNSAKSTIVLLGNPAVWWVGFALTIVTAGISILKKRINSIFITTFFFAQWIPYMLISRITFLYHFYINLPILCLASAYIVNKYWAKKWVKIISLIFFSLTVILFGYFYPVISGIPASISWIDSLKWLPGWFF